MGYIKWLITQLISDTYSLCIDLIFTSQPNLVVESGVHPSSHPNCHHQIIFAKFNLNIHYPPLCYCQVWHYWGAVTELIRWTIDLFNWKKAFENTSVDEKYAIFNKTILNIFHKFIPHETLLVGNTIKSLITEENTVFKHFHHSSNNLQVLNKWESFQTLLTKLIAEYRCNFYSRMRDKLHNTQKSSKRMGPSWKNSWTTKDTSYIPPNFLDNGFVAELKKSWTFQYIFCKTVFFDQ